MFHKVFFFGLNVRNWIFSYENLPDIMVWLNIGILCDLNDSGDACDFQLWSVITRNWESIEKGNNILILSISALMIFIFVEKTAYIRTMMKSPNLHTILVLSSLFLFNHWDISQSDQWHIGFSTHCSIQNYSKSSYLTFPQCENVKATYQLGLVTQVFLGRVIETYQINKTECFLVFFTQKSIYTCQSCLHYNLNIHGYT